MKRLMEREGDKQRYVETDVEKEAYRGEMETNRDMQ